MTGRRRALDDARAADDAREPLDLPTDVHGTEPERKPSYAPPADPDAPLDLVEQALVEMWVAVLLPKLSTASTDTRPPARCSSPSLGGGRQRPNE